jgi:ABC-2 type transport system ATP-binding protein
VKPILQVDQLRYLHGEQVVLQDVDLSLASGDFMALIGPNGSGKTTLLRCLAGILAPASGRVLINGHDTARELRSARQSLGFAVDPGRLPPLLTGRECLQLFSGTRQLPAIPGASLELAEILALGPMLDRRIAHYSLGMRQKLGILLGLLGTPPLLLLDEPLNGLDPLSSYALKGHLQMLARESNVAVLIATHALDVAERFASRAMLLMDGRLMRSWDPHELCAIRADPDCSLEQSMMQALV